MRFLILAHPEDRGAFQVAAQLMRRHGKREVRMVSPDELTLAPLWAHRVGDGAHVDELHLHDGTALGQPGVVFNRLRYLTMPHFANAPAADLEYAAMEMFALVLSWMTALRCNVLNPPAPYGLSGHANDAAQWQTLAGNAGFETQPWRSTSNARKSGMGLGQQPERRRGLGENARAVLVAGNEVIGSGTGAMHARCLQLSRMAKAPLLRIWLDDSNRFVAAGATPQFETDRELQAVVACLT